MATQILTHMVQKTGLLFLSVLMLETLNYCIIGIGTPALNLLSIPYPTLNSLGKYYANMDYYLPPQIVKTSWCSVITEI